MCLIWNLLLKKYRIAKCVTHVEQYWKCFLGCLRELNCLPSEQAREPCVHPLQFWGWCVSFYFSHFLKGKRGCYVSLFLEAEYRGCFSEHPPSLETEKHLCALLRNGAPEFWRLLLTVRMRRKCHMLPPKVRHILAWSIPPVIFLQVCELFVFIWVFLMHLGHKWNLDGFCPPDSHIIY